MPCVSRVVVSKLCGFTAMEHFGWPATTILSNSTRFNDAISKLSVGRSKQPVTRLYGPGSAAIGSTSTIITGNYWWRGLRLAFMPCVAQQTHTGRHKGFGDHARGRWRRSLCGIPDAPALLDRIARCFSRHDAYRELDSSRLSLDNADNAVGCIFNTIIIAIRGRIRVSQCRGTAPGKRA